MISSLGRINTTAQLHRILADYGDTTKSTLFRGQCDKSWKLVPKAGRPEFAFPKYSKIDFMLDLSQFREWRYAAYSLTDSLPELSHECLAFAQHHGLATRLLDWTYNPLVAAFFAARGQADLDGALFIHRAVWTFCEEDEQCLSECIEPHVARGDQMLALCKRALTMHAKEVRTRAMDARMLNQRSVFTIHCPPDKEITPADTDLLMGSVHKYIIGAGFKLKLLRHLDIYGINDSFVYPDIDGLAQSVNWATEQLAFNLKPKKLRRRARSAGAP